MEYGLGIDLGTTFSAAAISTAETVEVFFLGARSATTPSVVVVREHGEVLVGEAAQRRALSEPARSAREFKRRLGDPTPIFLGGVPYGAESLTAHLLRAVVEQVAQRQGGRPTRIALTHPATYRDYKLDLMRLAVGQADVGAVTFVSEPDAAARYYASQDRLDDGAVVAVYDFGGGTFDATVVRKQADAFELLGTPEGMERIGGIDFDEALLAHVDESLGGALAALDVEDAATRTALARLRDECRQAKEALSSDTDVSIPVALPNLSTEVRVTRSGFEALIRPRVAETIEALQRAVRSTGLGMADISRVLMVGGTSHIPLVRQMVRDATGRPVALDAHPKHSVSLGAAQTVRPVSRAHIPSHPTQGPPDSNVSTQGHPQFTDSTQGPPDSNVSTQGHPDSTHTTQGRPDSAPQRMPAAEGAALGWRRALLVGAVVLVLVLAAVGYFVFRPSDEPRAQDANPTGAPTSAGPAATEGRGVPGASSGAPTFGDLEITLGAAASEAPSLVIPVQLHNLLTASPVLISGLRYTLDLADGEPIAGSERLNLQVVDPGSSGNLELVFPGAADAATEDASLTIDAPGKVPLELSLTDGAAASSPPPALTAAGPASVTGPFATLTYVVDTAELSPDRHIEEGTAGQSAADRRADVGTQFLALSVSLTAAGCQCPGGVNWGSTDLSLSVDGMIISPWTSASGLVQVGATVSFDIGFVIPDDADQIVFQAGGPTVSDPATQIAITRS
ncbi:MAG: Hsp70 family protein [Geodermatophilaceae bacterium]|nr:Hsp70 family protein [Geodermatophilaceae bacterium]